MVGYNNVFLFQRVKAKSDGVEEAPAAQTLDISSIEKASFLQEEQYSSHGILT